MESSPVYDSEDICEKNYPEEKSANDFPISDMFSNDKTGGSDLINTSISISQFDNKFYFSDDKSLDKTIDEAISKYENTYERNIKKVKDASVQTTNHVPGTINKQCQCDLGFSENPNSTHEENPPLKKVKLNICGYEYEYISHRNVTWKSEPPEQQQDEVKMSREILTDVHRAIFEESKGLENSNSTTRLNKFTVCMFSQEDSISLWPYRVKHYEMSFAGSETISALQGLNAGVYNKLVFLLGENLAWKTVAETLGIFSAVDIQIFMRNKHPAEKLLFELEARLCTVDILCDVLKECQLYNILMLFKGKEPLRIVEQSYASEDNNFQMVIRGQSFTLIAKAVGLPPPTYQWYHNNVELLDKTDSILVLPHFDLDCEGEYYCLIDQEDGEAICSNPVVLTLAPERPVILKQPSSREVCPVGSKVTLFVKAKGHPELNYQWYKGNHQLDGCTSPTLLVDVKEDCEDYKYRCYVYNSSGEVWSNECTVTVYTTPHPEPSAKLALLIANQLYNNLNRLFTPENDVKTLASLLQDLGFHVISLQNLNLIEMRNAIEVFSRLLPADAYVVFYFAGHGFEIQDKFMLPVDTPGPEDYLQTDAICERELLKVILSSKPKLFLQLLDMCLKPPSTLNKKIFQEKTDLYEYEANNNLIQGYSTTSYLGAYEKKTAKNGLYVEHLKKYLSKDSDLPVVEILQKVAKDVAASCMKQKPFFGTNVTMDYRLTDHCRSDSSIEKKIRDLSAVPPDTTLRFSRACIDSQASFFPFLNVFLNTIEIRFTNLEDYRAICETEGEDLSFELTRESSDLVIKVMNLQRLVTNKSLTLGLIKNDELVDCAVLDMGKPMIAVADLWWNPEVRRHWVQTRRN